MAVWPLGRAAVYTSPREWRDGFWLQDGTWQPAGWHAGCDWAAPPGTPVRAAHDGWVEQLNQPDGAGLYVNLIASGYVMRSMYMHLSGFGAGGWVSAGDIIGYVGSTGASTGPHLHFQVHVPASGWPSVEPVAWLIQGEITDVPGQVYAWCREQGLSDAAAAGWMGNMRAECGNPYTGAEMDPAIVEGFTYDLEDLVPGVKEGVGMIQFSYSRRVGLIDYAHRQRHRPWQQPEVQLDYMLVEIDREQRYRDMWARLQRHSDPVAASQDIARTYIRPGHYGDRDIYAVAYLERIRAGEFGTPTPQPIPARRFVFAPAVTL